MELPRVYEIKENTPERYRIHEGKPKLSYSQYTSFKDPLYKGSYIGQYFLGIKDDGNIFSTYGSACGGYLETSFERGDLSDFDISVLDSLERPSNAVYEREIVIDRGNYVIQGFIDREYLDIEGNLVLEDFKTGSIKTKKEFYSSKEYRQTLMYAHQRTLEGEHIAYCGVILLDRKGNGQEKYPLRLTGEIEYIETPYCRKEAEAFLKNVDKVAKEISAYYQVYKKLVS
jgi:hypothetical protein